MAETVEQVAARLGITPAELERRSDEQRAALRRNTSSPCFGGNKPTEAATAMPSGYDPGSHELRFPDQHARAMGEKRALWVKPGKGRPSVASPLELALSRFEAERLKLVGANRRKPAAIKASNEASKARSAKAQANREAVATLTAQGKLPHTIARAVGITARRVKQIQAAAKQAEITAAEK